MGFFDDLTPPEPDPEPETEECAPPPWYGPPENILGGLVPVQLTLIKTPDRAVAIDGFIAYPTGVSFTLEIRCRLERDPRAETTLIAGPSFFDYEPRIGVEFADGSKAIANAPIFAHDESPPAAPVLMFRGGGGGSKMFSQKVWLWPLPPPGPMNIYIDWPIYGLPERRIELDANRLIEAAGLATELWPERIPPEGTVGIWVTGRNGS